MKLSKIKAWEEDLKYYDPEKIELKTLLRLADFRRKRVLDVGCGIGRLTLPISKLAKEVVAIDIDKDIIAYCKKYKFRSNIKYIKNNIRNFNQENFDIAILAQPMYDNFKENLDTISNALNSKGKLIIIRWIDKGNDYNAILTPFWNKDKKLMKDVAKFSRYFIRIIKLFYRIKKIRLVKTYESYPNKEKLKKTVISDCPKLNANDIKILNKLINKYNYRKINIVMNIYVCERVSSETIE